LTDLELLNLPVGSTAGEIKQRWRQLAKVLHPDYGGDANKFQELRQAYERAHDKALKPKTCPECKGTRRIFTNYGFATTTLTCKYCKGTGEVIQ